MASAASRLLESSSAVFAALEGRFAEPVESPTDEEVAEAAVQSPDGWSAFAAGLAARGKASRVRPGQPLDPQVATAALDLWECSEGPATEALAYQPLAPYLVVMGKGSIRRLHRGDGCWKAKALAFREYEILEDEPPSQDKYDQYCRKCWPHTSPPVPEASEDGSASSSSSSSSGA